jgi:tetratricopeptide (TPR) repeat protein
MTEAIEALMRQGQWERARQEAEVLAREHPTSAKLHAYVGLCHFRLGRFAQAVPHLTQATCLDERYVDAGLKLAQALDRLQRYEEALDVAEQFYRVDPNNEALARLISGLRRQVPPKITDSWELTTVLDRYEIRLASEAD